MRSLIILSLLIGLNANAEISCKTANDTLSVVLYFHPDAFDLNERFEEDIYSRYCTDWQRTDEVTFQYIGSDQNSRSDFTLFKALCSRLERCK